MITISKKEAETKLNRQLKFADAKSEWLQINKFDKKSWEAKNYEYALNFDNNFLCFEKPSIKTRFCFGYGQNGVTTDEDFDRASAQQHFLNTNQQAFVDANLEDLNKSIKKIETFINQLLDKKEKCFSSRYNKIFICKNSCDHLAYLAWSWNYDNIRNKEDIIKEATKDDLLLIIEVYKQQIENFKKRLNTYLKKYGLSKLHTWTYLID